MLLFTKCPKCGAEFDIGLFRENRPYFQEWEKSGVCYSCYFWDRFFTNREENTFIIDNKVYAVDVIKNDYKTIRQPRSGVHMLYLVSLDFSNIIRCWSNITLIGELGEFQQTKHPNEYGFVSRETYWRMADCWIENSCPRKGCYDRYHCVFYHPEISEPDGPWNTIPKNYRIGEEYCESFVDKDNLFIKNE